MKLWQLTAREIRNMLRKREISAIEVVEDRYHRIESIKEDGTCSFIALTREKAYRDAQKVDKAIKEGEALSDLAGIPMALKDSICTEGIETTCASGMLAGFIPPYSAEAYGRLADAGSIIIGKTNMDEFDVECPIDSQDRSAAAVASGEVCFSIASDAGGSIRQSAASHGVVGMKPTYGTVSGYGLITSAPSLDQIGPITRDVSDCALVMNCIGGFDPKDPASARIPKIDYREALVNDIKGLRLGIPREYLDGGVDSRTWKLMPEQEGTSEQLRMFEQGKALDNVSVKDRGGISEQIKIFQSLGACIEEISLPHVLYAPRIYDIIAAVEASSNLARYDGVRYGRRAEKHDGLFDFYVKTRSEGFGTEVKKRILLGAFLLSPGNYDLYYKKALQIRRLIREDFERAFEKCDVIIAVSGENARYFPSDYMGNTLDIADAFTASVNISGYTAISVPCGMSGGFPAGMQITGKPFDEKKILRAAFAYEQSCRPGTKGSVPGTGVPYEI